MFDFGTGMLAFYGIHAHGTHTITCLVVCAHQITKNGSCIVSVEFLKVACIHLSCMTQLHMTHSAMCNIVWFHQDSHTRHPVGVPGMVDQP